MKKVTSKDRTTIAYEQVGSGPSVILVDGAFGYRAFGPNGGLAAVLAQNFTVFTYDRRGRGDSGDTAPYAVEREVEDIEALINEAGGAVHLYGFSSGAALALEAANKFGVKVKKLALYEAPLAIDNSRPPVPEGYRAQVEKLIAANRREEAIKYFITKVMGHPGIFVAMMRVMPAWSKMKAVAHTLPYDNAVMADYEHGRPLPPDRWTAVTVPTLVLSGGKSPQWMQNGMRALAAVLPNARHQTLAGQTHLAKPAALATVLKEFFMNEAVTEYIQTIK